MGFAIYHDLVINGSSSKVFEAVSEPDHLINWCPLKCSGNPKVGGAYSFYFAPEFDWYGQVTKCKRNKVFHVKMTDSDSDWNPTTFGFDMDEIDDKTQLKFWHRGWPACNDNYKKSSFCWAMLLNGLKNYVEKGVIIPFKDRE